MKTEAQVRNALRQFIQAYCMCVKLGETKTDFGEKLLDTIDTLKFVLGEESELEHAVAAMEAVEASVKRAQGN